MKSLKYSLNMALFVAALSSLYGQAQSPAPETPVQAPKVEEKKVQKEEIKKVKKAKRKHRKEVKKEARKEQKASLENNSKT